MFPKIIVDHSPKILPTIHQQKNMIEVVFFYISQLKTLHVS